MRLSNVRKLTDNDALSYQRRGYFDEHLVTLYSLAYGEPCIYKETYLLYYDSIKKELSITLFELNKNEGNSHEDRMECIQAGIDAFAPERITLTTPERMPQALGGYRCQAVFFDCDYQIYLPEFDEKLRGHRYKDLRYRVHNAAKREYFLEVGKHVTQKHIDLVDLHLAKRTLNPWDIDLCESVVRYIRKFSSPKLFNAFQGDALLGFDVVDFLDGTMATPLGFSLDYPSLADFITFKEVEYAKKQGLEWLDLGWACNSGLENFKKKWLAAPRFYVWTQEYISK